jgi:two-component system, NarL family, nitrate/nitrite response regulator NarL
VQILVADDHPLYREAVRLRLERLLTDCAVVEVGTLAELLERVRTEPQPRFDLVLLDLYLPDAGPQESVAAVSQALPETPVVLMSGTASPEDVQIALGAGLRGFLPKTMRSDLFAMAISMVLAGGTYVPAEMMQGAPASLSAAAAPTVDAAAAPVSGAAERLTPRERQVLAQLASGASNKEIGRDLNLAEVTVKLHVRQILRKINARNRSEAAAIATRSGLI